MQANVPYSGWLLVGQFACQDPKRARVNVNACTLETRAFFLSFFSLFFLLFSPPYPIVILIVALWESCSRADREGVQSFAWHRDSGSSGSLQQLKISVFISWTMTEKHVVVLNRSKSYPVWRVHSTAYTRRPRPVGTMPTQPAWPACQHAG